MTSRRSDRPGGDDTNPDDSPPDPRQDRRRESEEADGRLHPVLRWAFLPWRIARRLAFPSLRLYLILVPAACGPAAILLAWLKWNDLEDMSWGDVARLATAPIWVYVALVYLFMAWIAVGCVPWAVVVLGQQWWQGKHFDLRGPDVGATDAARRELLVALRERRIFDRDDIRAFVAVHESSERRSMLAAKVAAGVLAVSGIVVVVNKLRWGGAVHEANARIFMVSLATLLPIVLTYDPRFAWRLKCHHCTKALRWIDLPALLESYSCPHCSGSPPLAEHRRR